MKFFVPNILYWVSRCSYIYGTVVEEEDPAVQKTMFAEFQQLLETLKNINRWGSERVSCVMTEWSTNSQQKWVRAPTWGQTPPARHLHISSARHFLQAVRGGAFWSEFWSDCSILKENFKASDYLIMCLYGLIILISLFGNFLVFSVIIRTRRLHTITNLFIANLALGDLLMTTFNIPFTVVGQRKIWRYDCKCSPSFEMFPFLNCK